MSKNKIVTELRSWLERIMVGTRISSSPDPESTRSKPMAPGSAT